MEMQISPYLWVFVVVLAWYLIMGLWIRRYVKTLDDYYVMGRRAPWWLFGPSVIATWLSLWTFMGGFGLAWVWGWGHNPMLWGGVCSPLGILFLTHFIGIRLRRGGFLTIPDYMEARFGSRRMRLIATLIAVISIYFYLIGQIVGGGIILEMLAGVPYVVGVAVMTIILVCYLIGGGFWTVIVTDLVGFSLMMLGGFLTIAGCLQVFGGWDKILLAAEKAVPGQLTSVWLGGGPLWLFSYGLSWVAIAGASAHIINRSLAVRSDKDVVLGGTIGLLVAMTMVTVIYTACQGLAVLYKKGTIGVDYVWIDFLVKYAPMWFAVIFIAAMVFAALTTINGMIATIGTAIGRDLYGKFIRPEAPADKVLLWTRIGIIIAALAGLILSIFRPWWIVIVTAFAGAILAAGFFQTLYWSIFTDKLITEKGAFWTMAIGLPLSLIIIIGNHFWKWGAPAFPTLWTFIYGCIALPLFSALTKKTEKEIEAWKKLKTIFERPLEEVRERVKPTITDWIVLIVFTVICVGILAYLSYVFASLGF